MKGPTRKEEPPKPHNRIDYSKSKRIIPSNLISKSSPLPSTYDEAKACCKARKRKERQESISSLCQERKVIRSNSEERPTQKKYVETKHTIRRVYSSEDFQKSASIEKINVSPNRLSVANNASNEKNFAYDDCEHEKRRSHERFSRPLTLKSKKTQPHKRLKMRYVSRTKFKPEFSTHPETGQKDGKITLPPGGLVHEGSSNETKVAGFLQLHEKEKERSPSPVQTPVSPVLDLSTLHEQVDCSEPLLSCPTRQINENTETLPSLSVASNRLLSSPRNSIIATHCLYLDPDVAQRNVPLEMKHPNPVDERLQKLSKQINSTKKRIKKQEAEFEIKNGFKPSHINKLNDKQLKTLYADLSKLKKEQKQLTDISNNCSLIDDGMKRRLEEENASLQDTINEIEKKLTLKREVAKRGSVIEDLTSDQLLEEKIAIQKALLYLESIHGRPNNKIDRDLVRPFYDRYRTLKRMVAKIAPGSNTGAELATIHENETMEFVTPVPSQSFESESDKTPNVPSNSTDSDTSDTSISENLHSLSRDELFEQLKLVTEEKKELRRTIKEFEANLQLRTGKMIQKEEKAPIENVYMLYKKTKAKLRLLEALVGKQT